MALCIETIAVSFLCLWLGGKRFELFRGPSLLYLFFPYFFPIGPSSGCHLSHFLSLSPNRHVCVWFVICIRFLRWDGYIQEKTVFPSLKSLVSDYCHPLVVHQMQSLWFSSGLSGMFKACFKGYWYQIEIIQHLE